MRLYIDSSILVKLYYPEPESIRVENLIKSLKEPILFTPFHELETTNAFALKVFRNEISMEEFNNWQAVLKTDKTAGILKPVNPDWSKVFIEALEISKFQSSHTGTRSLDIIHIAAAGTLNCDTFFTNDKKQALAAESFGLKTMAP